MEKEEMFEAINSLIAKYEDMSSYSHNCTLWELGRIDGSGDVVRELKEIVEQFQRELADLGAITASLQSDLRIELEGMKQGLAGSSMSPALMEGQYRRMGEIIKTLIVINSHIPAWQMGELIVMKPTTFDEDSAPRAYGYLWGSSEEEENNLAWDLEGVVLIDRASGRVVSNDGHHRIPDGWEERGEMAYPSPEKA